MNFLGILSLLGLLTLPVILLLHLLRSRRQLLAISNLRLWQVLQEKRYGGRPRSIPLSLMLLLQLLFTCALIVALVRPAFSFLLGQPRQAIFILDMTTSMTAQDTSPGNHRFDTARQMIWDQLQTLEETDTFAIISLTLQPEILLKGDGQQKAAALATLDRLTPGATGQNLPAALTLANGLIDDLDRAHQITVLSDSTYPVKADTLPAMLAPVEWRTLSSQPQPEGNVANQALINVSARPLSDERHRLFARVINYSNAPVARTLRVLADDQLLTELTLNLGANGEAAQVWTLPAQAETATVEIVEPDALPLDNQANLLLTGTTPRQILLVSDTPDIMAQALAVQPGVKLTLDPLEMTHDPANFDMVIFDGLPPDLKSWPVGSVLVINPPLSHPLLSAVTYAHNLRPNPETASPLLAGVDLSGAYFKRVPQLSLPNWARVDLAAISPDPDQEIPSDQPLIFHGPVDNSRLVVWAFDLAESNLPARLALPLLTANTLSSLLSVSPPPVVPVGQPVMLNSNFSIELPGGQQLSTGLTTNQSAQTLFSRTKQPGLYRIYDEAGVPVGGFAVQAGSALESNLTTQLQPDTLNLAHLPGEPINDPDVRHDEFWPWLVGLALLLLIFEGWLAWRT